MNEFKSLKAINDACADATISEVRYTELLEKFKSEIRADERARAIEEILKRIEIGIEATGHCDEYETGFSNALIWLKSCITNEEAQYYEI